MLHKNVPVGDMHFLQNWEVADEAARLALTPVAADVGKICRQLDTNVFYLLLDDTPLTWEVIGSAGESQSAVLSVRNTTGFTITKGSAVYIIGALSQVATIALAKADAEATSSKTIGIVKADIPNNSVGTVVVSGKLVNMDTSAFADGDSVYLSDATAGAWATTRPVAPSHGVFLGYVVYSHATKGIVVVRVQNGFEVEELHNVLLTAIADGQVLQYEAATGLWKNVAKPTVGRHSIPVMAGYIAPSVTGGCAAVARLASAANQPDIVTLDFDTTTQEFAQFAIPMPKKWDEGTITFKAIWSHAATTVNFGVVWGLQAVAISDADPIAVAYGTGVNVTDTGGTTNSVYTSPESTAITIAGTPVAEDLVMFRVFRVPADAADTMAIDARLHGLIIYVNTATNTDA